MAGTNSFRKPKPDPRPDDYDEVLDESFPASDPPPGVIELGGPGHVRRPLSSESASDAYDDVVEQSFPASDPPPGVIKVGPRKKLPGQA